MPEAFAAVREAAKRTLGMRAFDVQVMGGAALHLGNIAEMKTGEGKTLVATSPAYLNAIAGKGVHIVTVERLPRELPGRAHGPRLPRPRNDDGHASSPVRPAVVRREQYNADITYGTNNEFGFDYLRDNMAGVRKTCVQRGHFFAIVDEVDSILIDEARTPLIISGPSSGEANRWFGEFAQHRQDARGPASTTRSTRRSAPSACSSLASRRSRTTSASTNLYESANTPADLVPEQLDQGDRAVQPR